VLGVAVDITDQERAKEERRKLEDKILQAQKLESLGVMAGGIAHDFNNLLMVILGYANLASMELGVTPSGREHIKKIETAAKDAADLCNQMLAYSGKGRFLVTTLDLNDIVHEMPHLLKVSIGKNAVMKFNLSDDLPSIEADASQMRQVIMNLIVNASEAIGDDSGVITAGTRAVELESKDINALYLGRKLSPGLYVRVEVTDTGCGMDEETRSRIFDPFFTTKFTGRGLGLAAVSGIVRSHKGGIMLSSKPGEGATFKVFFPVTEKPVGRDAKAPQPPAELRGSGTILVVDDQQDVREVTRGMLEARGFTVLTAGSGAEGVELLCVRGDDIAAVILDLTMPGMDGEETFHAMRRAKNDVRVILASGYSESDLAERFANMGVAGFIHKPCRIDDLVAKIRNAAPKTGGV